MLASWVQEKLIYYFMCSCCKADQRVNEISFHKDEDWGIGIDIDEHDSIENSPGGSDERGSETDIRSPLSSTSHSSSSDPRDDSLDEADVKPSGWKVYKQMNTESPKSVSGDTRQPHYSD